ncbi:MAG: PAS domain S-box protein [Negativicutes bacterium]|nr:PAS domain S-box protein [Negativicutes bacterium]
MESILFVTTAPLVGASAKKVMAEMGINIPMIAGNLKDVQDVVRNNPEVGVFISRGGTAEALSWSTGKPVVYITATLCDFLQPIHRLVARGHTKIAIVANHTLIDDGVQNVQVGAAEIFVRPWRFVDGVKCFCDDFAQLGIQGVVGDQSGGTIAEQYGLPVELLDSGPEALKRAINEALKIAKAKEQERLLDEARLTFLETAVELRTQDLLAMNEELQSSYAELEMEIADRQRAEEQLRLSERKTKILVDAIPDVIAVITPACKILDFKATKNFASALDSSSYSGKTVDEVVPPSVASLYRQNVPLAFSTKETVSFEYEIPVNGEIRVRETRVVAMSEEEALIIVRDITENKKASEEINKLSLAVDQSPGITVITDTQGRISYVNAKFSQVTGYSFEEAIGQNPRMLKSGTHSDEFYQKIWDVITAGEEWNGEFCNQKKNGELFWTLASISPVKNLEGKIAYYLAIQQDITEQKETAKILEAQHIEIQETMRKLQQTQSHLVQHEKMAGIGQLAAGVAHEINNPLGFISSNFETLQKYVGRLQEMITAYEELHNQVLTEQVPSLQQSAEQLSALSKQKKLNYILQDLEPVFKETTDGLCRVGNIVKALRLFSRVDKQNAFEEYDLNEGIRTSLTVARNEIKYVAEVKENLEEIPAIMAISGQINQVLLNIVINAAHAIKAAKGDEDLGVITISTRADEQFVYCMIEDTGTGIPEAIQKDVFNPFFTTKPAGQGTGLGLSISYDIIVNKHHGEILLESEEGKGTTFTIKLPRDNGRQINECG